MSKSIVVVGSVNIDLVGRTSRIPLVGETLSGTDFLTFSGGKGANQAVAAARLGEATHFIGKVGKDIFGEQLRDELVASGVNITGVSVAEGSSGVALIITTEDGQNAIVVMPGANAELRRNDLESNIEIINKADILLTQLEISLDTVDYLAMLASERKIPLVLDPAPAIQLPSSILRRVTWLTPNETEVCSLLGISITDIEEKNLSDIAGSFQKLGAKNILLKLGEKGCFLRLEDGTTELVKAPIVEAIDTTAAGDAFNGAFASALIRGKDPVSSAWWASKVATLSVTRKGAQSSMPTLTELDDFIARLDR